MDPSWNSGNFRYGGNFNQGYGYNMGYAPGYDPSGYGQGFDQSGYQMGYGQYDYSGYGQFGPYDGYGDAQTHVYQQVGGNGNFPGFPGGNPGMYPGMNPGRGRGAPGMNKQKVVKPGAKAAGAQGKKTEDVTKKAKEVNPPLPESPPPPPPPDSPPPPPPPGPPPNNESPKAPVVSKAGESTVTTTLATESKASTSKDAGEDDMDIDEDEEEDEEENNGKMTFKEKKMMSLSALLCHFENEKEKDAPAKKEEKLKNAPAKKEEKLKNAPAKKEEKLKNAPAKKEEKLKDARAKKEEKLKDAPAKKEEKLKVAPAKKEEEEHDDADDEDEDFDDKNVVTFEEKMAGSLSALLGLVKQDAQPLKPVKKYPKPSKGPSVTPKEPPKKLFTQNPTNPSLVNFNTNNSMKPQGQSSTNAKKSGKLYGPFTQALKQWNWLEVGKVHDNRITPEMQAAFATGQGMANFQYLNENQRKGLTPSGKDKSEINFFYKVPKEAYSCPEDMKETSSKKRIARLAELVKLKYCKICSIIFPNTMSSKQHYEGKRHFIKLRSFLKSGEKKDQGGVALCCKVCNVIYCDEHHKNVHLNGKPHAKMVLTLKQRGIIPFDAPINDPTVRGPAFKDESDEEDELTLGEARKWLMTKIDKSDTLCAVCDMGFSSVYSALEHYHGKNHEKKLTAAAAKRKLTMDDVIVLGADEIKYECILCNATLNSRESLNEHVVGMRHQNKLRARQIYAKNRGLRGGRMGKGARGGRDGGEARDKWGGKLSRRGRGVGGKAGIIEPKKNFGIQAFGPPIGGPVGQEGAGQDGFTFGEGKSDGAGFVKGQKRPWGQQQGGGGFSGKNPQFIQFQPATKKFQTGDGHVIMGPSSGRGGFQGGRGAGRGGGQASYQTGGQGGYQMGAQGGYQTGGQGGYQMGGQGGYRTGNQVVYQTGGPQGFQDGNYQGYGDYQYQNF